MNYDKYIDPDIIEKFEYYNYGHALEILHESFPEEWEELQVQTFQSLPYLLHKSLMQSQ